MFKDGMRVGTRVQVVIPVALKKNLKSPAVQR